MMLFSNELPQRYVHLITADIPAAACQRRNLPVLLQHASPETYEKLAGVTHHRNGEGCQGHTRDRSLAMLQEATGSPGHARIMFGLRATGHQVAATLRGGGRPLAPLPCKHSVGGRPRQCNEARSWTMQPSWWWHRHSVAQPAPGRTRHTGAETGPLQLLGGRMHHQDLDGLAGQEIALET